MLQKAGFKVSTTFSGASTGAASSWTREWALFMTMDSLRSSVPETPSANPTSSILDGPQVTPETPAYWHEEEVVVWTRPAADGKVSFQVGPGQNGGASFNLTALVEATMRTRAIDFIVILIKLLYQ